ncbi:MAG TPA: hypothetical protein VME43_21235 [Bryobacteraceae bacterium]|nr:hypothetical protein [Bryobacteraceae bacterium]
MGPTGSVAIQGEGVAAACCAWLLGGAGIPFSVARQARTRVPAILVSQATQALMADVFQQPSLFEGLPRLERRIVAWGPGAEPVTLPHSAVVVSEEALVGRIEPRGPLADAGQFPEWRLFASRPLPASAALRCFGSRHAWAVAAELKAPEAASCWVESLGNGWLFLIPGWLIAVGAAPDALLAASRLVAGQIRGIRGDPAEFPAYPRIADPLGGPGWLACGSAAMAFDPICGDGSGNAVREAILACAVIRAAARGEPPGRLLAHYRRRLMAGFLRHLELALQFYRSGDGGPWWDEEAQALQRGVGWCAGELARAPAFHYRLEGFDLLPASVR